MKCYLILHIYSFGYTEFYKTAAMGGEIYPPLQEKIFSSSYPTGTSFHQDFGSCADVTHATYMLNNYAFSPGYSGTDLDNTISASQGLGYSFVVEEVKVEELDDNEVAITVQVMQVGIAPFYYPLALTLSCVGMSTMSQSGVELIIDKGSSRQFTFTNVPANDTCLNAVEISLSSPYAYSNNPVKFSQGDDGSKVVVSLPSPPTAPTPTAPTPTSDDCVDFGNRIRFDIGNGSKISRSCEWVGNKSTNQRCAYDGVSEACPLTCGTCDSCADPPTSLRFKFQKDGAMVTRSCDWVTRKQTAARCTHTDNICRAACGVC